MASPSKKKTHHTPKPAHKIARSIGEAGAYVWRLVSPLKQGKKVFCPISGLNMGIRVRHILEELGYHTAHIHGNNLICDPVDADLAASLSDLRTRGVALQAHIWSYDSRRRPSVGEVKLRTISRGRADTGSQARSDTKSP